MLCYINFTVFAKSSCFRVTLLFSLYTSSYRHKQPTEVSLTVAIDQGKQTGFHNYHLTPFHQGLVKEETVLDDDQHIRYIPNSCEK